MLHPALGLLFLCCEVTVPLCEPAWHVTSNTAQAYRHHTSVTHQSHSLMSTVDERKRQVVCRVRSHVVDASLISLPRLQETVADELEEAYRSHIWDPSLRHVKKQKQGVTAARVELTSLFTKARLLSDFSCGISLCACWQVTQHGVAPLKVVIISTESTSQMPMSTCCQSMSGFAPTVTLVCLHGSSDNPICACHASSVRFISKSVTSARPIILWHANQAFVITASSCTDFIGQNNTCKGSEQLGLRL